MDGGFYYVEIRDRTQKIAQHSNVQLSDSLFSMSLSISV